MHDGSAMLDSQEAGDEIAGHAIRGREADDAIAGADVGVTGSMKSDEKTVAEQGIVLREIFEAEWGAVGGESGVRGRNLFAGAERARCMAEVAVRIGCEGMPTASSEIGAARGYATLPAVDGVAR